MNVFVDERGRPRHLAVLIERPQDRKGLQYRSLCGEDFQQMEVRDMPPSDVRTGCKTCDEQADMWREVHD